tara:strand:- start:218 stop:346 length:129 start_codon:yes stop_codon:yes gene_type:complete
MKVQYVVISIILGVIVLVIAIAAVSGTPGIIQTILDMFGSVK